MKLPTKPALTPGQHVFVLDSLIASALKGNQELFQKAYAALRSGGSLVLNDFFPNEERAGPNFALRFYVYTLTHTPEGECWTLSQYSDWLKTAEFKSIETHSDRPRRYQARFDRR